MQQGSILEVEARTGCEGEILKHCLGMQGWCQESQSSAPVETCKDVKGNKKDFYCYISNRRLNKGSVGLVLNG